ncbi:hypothetical protein [Saccharopolyspora elongata]|uniref:hypothetical protein n=1 Tax=Saccharopolyspora elongata TaxID=2530387 RepID=UPI0014047533|nr:hypothetical protein [Saccharopolyspora elongata]
MSTSDCRPSVTGPGEPHPGNLSSPDLILGAGFVGDGRDRSAHGSATEEETAPSWDSNNGDDGGDSDQENWMPPSIITD